jgi:hypothetical protein
LGKVNNIETLHDQLMSKRQKVGNIKKIVLIINTVSIVINLLILFFYFKYISTTIRVSIYTLIISIGVSYIYRQAILDECKDLELKIYDKQKLKE